VDVTPAVVPGAPPGVRRWPSPLLAVVLIAGVGLVFTWLHHPRLGLYLVSGSLWLAAAARLFLSPHAAGLLVVRSRLFDTLTLGLFAAAVFTVATITSFPRPGR
jgi:hypothetical protein